jgi:hypothetical protein
MIKTQISHKKPMVKYFKLMNKVMNLNSGNHF